MFVAFAGTLSHCPFSNLEKLIQYHQFENWIDERIAGVDTTFHHLDSEISIDELQAKVINQHIKTKENTIIESNFFMRNF